MMVLLGKILSNINLKTITILILVALLGPERVSADRYITCLKIQIEIYEDGRQVKTIILIDYLHLKFKS